MVACHTRSMKKKKKKKNGTDDGVMADYNQVTDFGDGTTTIGGQQCVLAGWSVGRSPRLLALFCPGSGIRSKCVCVCLIIGG